MHDEIRSALLVFALLTLLSAVPVVLRRFRPPLLAVVHAQGLALVAALVACAATGEGDARPLLLPYLVGIALAALGGAGPAGGRPVPRVLAHGGLVLGLLGAAATGATLFSLPLPLWARLPLVGLAGAFGGLSAWRTLSRAKVAGSAPEKRADQTAAFATALATLAVMSAFVPDAPSSARWAPWLALAVSLTTATRVPPFVPPSAREGVSALFVGLTLLFASDAAAPLEAVWRGLDGALVALAVLAASRPLLLARPRGPTRRDAPGEREKAPPLLLAEAALGHMSPMLDDALLFRPSRPRVYARVTARRLLEASLESARAAGPPGRRSLGIDLREDDADVDVEGDPAELAEALAAVLDNALRLKQEHPNLAVRVHVRGSPTHVTFEVEDDLACHVDEGEAPSPSFVPFASTRGEGGPKDGLSVGVGLARAKLLVERQGGVLLARRTSDGSCVQLTVPRRRVRHPYGLA